MLKPTDAIIKLSATCLWCVCTIESRVASTPNFGNFTDIYFVRVEYLQTI